MKLILVMTVAAVLGLAGNLVWSQATASTQTADQIVIASDSVRLASRRGRPPLAQTAGPIVSVSDLRIVPSSRNQNRTSLYGVFQILDLSGLIDREMENSGNILGRCSKRLFWRGDTEMLEPPNDGKLQLSTRMRYQQWVCAIFKSKLFSKTDRVHWALSIPQGPIRDKVTLNLQVLQIGSNKDFIEEFLTDLLGIDKLLRVSLPIPEQCGGCSCSEVFEALQPALDEAEFLQADTKTGDVELALEFSIENNLKPILECIN